MSFLTLKPIRDLSVSVFYAGVAAVAVIASQIGDTVTTIVGLGRGAEELNPLMLDAYQTYGPAGVIGVKVVATAVILAATWRRRYAPWVIAALFTAVTISNMGAISQLS